MNTATTHKYEEPLLQKVQENDHGACAALLASGTDVNVKDKSKECTALHVAAKTGNLEIFDMLLDAGADYNAQDCAKQSPLHVVVQKGHLDLCKTLLSKADIKVNIEDNNKDMPLHLAAKHGQENTCRELVNHHETDVNPKNKKGMSPLHVAARENRSGIISILRSKHADFKMQDKHSYWPIHYAALKGFPDACEALLCNCSDADRNAQLQAGLKDGKTPMILAAINGHHRSCTKLTRMAIDATDNEGHTALHYAIDSGYVKTVGKLWEMEANPNTRNKEGTAPIHKAASKKTAGCLKVLCQQRIPVDTGAQLQILDGHKKTVFHYAVQKNAEECLRYLLSIDSVKPYINNKDTDNCSPLHTAIQNDAVECVQILLENEASPVEQCEGGKTPLHLAAEKGSAGICTSLLDKPGVQVNQGDANQATPLHTAARHGSVDVCRVLIRKGASLETVDDNGKTALHIASQNRHTKVVKFLIKKGALQSAKDHTDSTPLHDAASNGSLDCCKALRTTGKANWEADRTGKLAVNKAFENKHDHVFKYLLMLLPCDENRKDRKKQLKLLHELLHEYMHTALKEDRR